MDESIQIGEVMREKMPLQILHQTLCGIEFGQCADGAVIEIDRTVLLSAAAEGEDGAERHAVLLHSAQTTC